MHRFIRVHTICTLALLLGACGSSEDDSSYFEYDAQAHDAAPSDSQGQEADFPTVKDAGNDAVFDVEMDSTLETGTDDVIDAETDDVVDSGSDSAVDAEDPEPPGPPEVTVGTVTETKLFGVTGTTNSYKTVQGGGSDGTYAYVVLLNRQSSGIDISQLVKYQISNGKRVSTASFNAPGNVTNQLGHGNDVTFNPDTGRLIVPAWTNDSSKQPTDNGKHLRIIDPGTLKIVDTKTVDVNATNLCYAKGSYVIFSGGKFRTYDANFALTQTVPFDIKAVEDEYAPTGDRVGQGIDCDADYVYITRWYPGPKTNCIYVANHKGELVGVYYTGGSEGEHLMHVSGERILHGFNNLGAVGGELRRIDKLQFVVTYLAEGGSGSMPKTRVLYGRKTNLHKNAFSLSGKQFIGWAAERESDGKWRYQSTDGKDSAWHTKGTQPSGWSYYVYKDRAIVYASAPFGLVKMHAQWE